MRIATVVGARPQFVKAGAVSRVLRRSAQEILIHTGQHYDAQMSQIFFDELGLPQPDHHLGVGSGSHGLQTARMIEKIEAVLQVEMPDWVLVYGDTNSTLAAALAAAKMHIPIAHVEAGLRSFNMRMPEEINRRLTDHISTLLFTPTDIASTQLEREGISSGIHQVGDVMYDVMGHYLPIAKERSQIVTDLALVPQEYVLLTVHRAENTDDPKRLPAILQALKSLGIPIVFPMHPRTRKQIEVLGLDNQLAEIPHLHCIAPVGYLDMLVLEENAQWILTDSGGVQKEAYFLGVPCLTLRKETEWQETVTSGWNRLVEPGDLLDAFTGAQRPISRPSFYGDGTASEQITEILAQPQC